MNDVLKHYEVLICGATAVAIGFAEQCPNKHLIIERTSFIAGEFIDSYNTGSRHWDAVTSSGAELKEELVKRNILNNEGFVHIPAAAPVMFKKVKDMKLNILFLTRIIKIERVEGCFEITLHNNSGFRKVTADSVIDTTSVGVFGGMAEKASEKSINAMLHCSDKVDFPFEDINLINNAGIRFYQGRFYGEIIMKFVVNRGDDWLTARQKLHRYWSTRPDALKPWNIASISSTFDIQIKCEVPLEVQPSMTWMPSCANDNLLRAYESGSLYAQKSANCGGKL